MQLLDQAVEQSPIDFRVLGARVVSSLKLPDRFERKSLALQDLKTMLSIVDQQRITSMPSNMKERILTQLVLLTGEMDMKEEQSNYYEQLSKMNGGEDFKTIAENVLIRQHQ